MANQWTTPADLKQQLVRHWDRGDLLRAGLQGDQRFPLKLRLRRPTSRELATRFDEVRQWVRQINKLYGYQVEWKEVRHPLHGRNSLPQSISVTDHVTALKLIGKSGQAALFQELCASTLQAFPELKPWLLRYPHKLLRHAGHWRQLIQVLRYFQQHPKSGLYLRQLDIEEVDTKFIEQHRGVLAELLDSILSETCIDRDATGVRGFSRRYGLKQEPPLIRFRLLDPRQSLQGLSDLSVPADQFAGLCLPVSTIFITENRINGLAFPNMADAVVIFGLGYGLDRLREISWLRSKSIHYWGDIDTHGFRMLNQLRKDFPRASSLLMDRETLMQHRTLWVQEKPNQRSLIDLPRLTDDEQQLYDDLRDDRIAEAIRLEQERIPYSWVTRALDNCPGIPEIL